MPECAPLGLFQGHGIELEYAIVSSDDYSVRPIADRLIERACGTVQNEIARGAFSWSNELARHVIEIKTNGPAARLAGLAAGFQAEVREIDALLAAEGARLIPGGMHPTMDPKREFVIWPHGDRKIYQTFDHIFDCSGHGWANLQSAHLNLPFADDDEFGRLHAAIRAILPILPALSAASPYYDGREAGWLDARLRVYAGNARRVPSVCGNVIPEPLFRRSDYESLLESIYADLAPHDPEGVLRHEWVNARGAIARFDRMAIEIRLLDAQECPRADLAIAAAVAATLCRLCREGGADHPLRELETAELEATLWRCAKQGDRARIDDPALLRALGLPASPRIAGEVWAWLIERDLAGSPEAAEHLPALEHILERGCLGRRMLERVDGPADPASLGALCRELCDCLAEGRQLGSGPQSAS